MSRIDELLSELCPAGVQHRVLSEVAELKRGTSITKKKTSPGSVPVVAGGRETAYHHGESNRTGETIVIAGSGAYAGLVTWWERPIFVSDAFSVKPDEKMLLPKFCFYWLQAQQKALYSLKNGGGVPHVYAKDVGRFRLPVPPLDAQREIIRVLDRFTLLEAQLEQALRAEVDARERQYSHYRIGLLSFGRESDWSALIDIAEYVNGKAHEKLVDPDGTIPMVTARFVSRNGEANRFVKPEDVLTTANVGDIALVLSDLPNGRALARTFYVDESDSYAINQRVARIRVRDANAVLPRYLFHVLDRNPGLLAHDNGVDQTHLSKAQVTGLRIPVPSVDEQLRIVRTLDTLKFLVDDISMALGSELAARRKQYEYFRDQLLTFEEATV